MADKDYNPLYSTDDIWVGDESNRCLSNDIYGIHDALVALPDTYAAKVHEHTGYATVDGLSKKADADHDHNELYYSKSEVDEKLASLKIEMSELVDALRAETINTTNQTDTNKTEESGAADGTESTEAVTGDTKTSDGAGE